MQKKNICSKNKKKRIIILNYKKKKFNFKKII
jgi:hypothetical protein